MNLIQKNRTNSISEFYHVIFRRKDIGDQEIHDNSRNEIQGTQFKNYYERFCYLHEYIEKNLEDKESINMLK